jgi:hypothetical protein
MTRSGRQPSSLIDQNANAVTSLLLLIWKHRWSSRSLKKLTKALLTSSKAKHWKEDPQNY